MQSFSYCFAFHRFLDSSQQLGLVSPHSHGPERADDSGALMSSSVKVVESFHEWTLAAPSQRGACQNSSLELQAAWKKPDVAMMSYPRCDPRIDPSSDNDRPVESGVSVRLNAITHQRGNVVQLTPER